MVKKTHRSLPDSSGAACIERLAAVMERRVLQFEARANHALAQALAAAYGLALEPAAVAFEQALHAGLGEAVDILPFYPIDRSEFDALPILDAGDESAVEKVSGLFRWQLRSFHILVLANGRGGGAFFKPLMDEPLPLN
jgi:hypothetical protein